jgi:hypothetical protein
VVVLELRSQPLLLVQLEWELELLLKIALLVLVT